MNQITVEELVSASEPLRKLLNDKGHPHLVAMVSQVGAVITEDIVSTGLIAENPVAAPIVSPSNDVPRRSQNEK